MDTILTIIVFVLMLTVLVVVHELGHFWAAKRAGVKVEEFGIGLPPKLWGKQIGETEWTINALPIGGFVRMQGEVSDGVSVREEAGGGRPEAEVDGDQGRSFGSKSVGWRAIILSAGVVANMVLAMVLFTIVYTAGIPTAVPDGSIEAVSQNSPAEEAGLEEGQRILALNGVAYDELEPSFAQQIQEKQGEEVVLRIEEPSGVEREVVVTPRTEVPAGEGALGVALGFQVEQVQYPIWTAWWEGTRSALEFSTLIVASLGDMLGGMVTRGDVPQDVSGPVGIASMVGDARQAGIIPVLFFAGIISVNLAVINLLPFPALDGGRLIFVAIEAVTRRKVSPQIEAMTHTAGMVLLLALIVAITFSDVSKLLR